MLLPSDAMVWSQLQGEEQHRQKRDNFSLGNYFHFYALTCKYFDFNLKYW